MARIRKRLPRPYDERSPPPARAVRKRGPSKQPQVFDEQAVGAALAGGLRAMSLEIDAATQQELVRYLALLCQWNTAYALSGVRDPLQMVSMHLLDSLVVLPFLEGEQCLDIGTGAGLPGLVLAIVDNTRHWTLLDASAKKATFCRQVAIELGLRNATAVHSRIETAGNEGAFDTATTRATFEPGLSARLAAPSLKPGGRLICMRGQPEPLPDVPGYSADGLHETPVPGADARHLLLLRRLR